MSDEQVSGSGGGDGTGRGRWPKGRSGNPAGRPRRDEAEASPVSSPADPMPRVRRGPFRTDGWASALGGIGGSLDKRLSGTFFADIISPETAAEMWRGDDIAARAIESVPNEMLRQGFDLLIGGGLEDAKEIAEKISSLWEDLGLIPALQEVLSYERAYGGGAIFLGVEDGQPIDEPIDLERVSKLSFLTVLESRELTPHRYYADPTAPRFGQVASYQVSPASPGTPLDGTAGPQKLVEIHASRLLVFPGIRVSRRRYHAMRGWGDSVLTRMTGVLRDFNMAHAATGILISDFAQPIFSVKGLAEMISDDEDDVVRARMEAVEVSRSVARLVMIDAEEKYERQATPVAGLPELLEALRIRLAAAADMPVTLLMGQSPAGLNATGESDIRFYYDRIRAMQERKLRHPIEYLVKLAFRTLNIKEPESWSIRFHPLWQPTEGERAAARLTQAQVDAIYIERGVVSQEEIALSRFGGDEFSFETIVDFTAREELEPIAASTTELDKPAEPVVELEAPPAGEATVDVAATALNGAQVSSLVDIVAQVNAGQLSRESAIAIIVVAFRLSDGDARAILGPEGFIPRAAEPAASPFGGGGFPPKKAGAPMFDAADGTGQTREDGEGDAT